MLASCSTDEYWPHVFERVFVRRRIFASQTEHEANEYEYLFVFVFVRGDTTVVYYFHHATTTTSWNSRQQSPTGGVFEPVRGTPVRNVPKRGKMVPKKGYFPNLVETAGYTLAQAFQKGVLGYTPLLITLVHPLYTREKKTLDGWDEPREHDKRCRF